MNPPNFANLATVLGSKIFRRHALKTYVASIVGGAIGLLVVAPVALALAPKSFCGASLKPTSDSLWQRVWDDTWDPTNGCVKKGGTSCKGQNIFPADGYRVQQQSPNLLMVATDRITGIECKALWDGTTTPHYWDLAWNKVAHDYLKHPAYLAKAGMAINPQYASGGQKGRQYNQLHIHVSCIKKDVQTYLAKNETSQWKDPKHWKTNTVTIGQYEYRVLVLDNENALVSTNLFKLLRDNVATNDADMAYQWLVVAKRPKGGFYVLNSQGNVAHGTAAGETNLLDETCKT